MYFSFHFNCYLQEGKLSLAHLTRTKQSHSRKNFWSPIAYIILTDEKWLHLLILTTSLIHLISLKVGRMYSLNLGVKGLIINYTVLTAPHVFPDVPTSGKLSPPFFSSVWIWKSEHSHKVQSVWLCFVTMNMSINLSAFSTSCDQEVPWLH